ncbi:apolipoprotein D-like isoform X2 [Aricia agestis]|nr:apolipoprotein D-like isoform X2 [Aricia agestis]
MANFNVNRFLGSWYEAERYFTVSELGSRCVKTKYESTPEGRILVSNEITNSLTGLKRVMEGSLQTIGREGEGRIIVKYSSLPVPYENEYSILDTDYDNYAVMWSCSGIGPVHIQNAWILTRDRLAPPMVMQYAYAALDRYKISRTFFVKTNQADCNVLPLPAATALQSDEFVVDLKKSPITEEAKEDVVPLEKSVPVVIPEVIRENVPVERSAAPEIPEEPKPAMQELEKKEEKKPEEMKDDKEKKTEIKEKKVGRKYIHRNH